MKFRSIVAVAAALAQLVMGCAGAQGTFSTGSGSAGAGSRQVCSQDADCSEAGSICQQNACVPRDR